ncbi:hypothetical protein BGX21_011616 [Mortierella sp. AD011]|nr:hypothetical protein BGX20_000504 [Mortierella sp. AD010]KAF9401978.1 hypothetical protein BGX21_011616 [Mortierella sp. AD011]
MSQESHSRQGSQRGGSIASRASSIARTSSTRSRTPSPDSYLQKQNSNQEPNSLEHESPSADATSLLGSMWNLVRDAREVAARELDKLLEHFPYKNTSKSTTAAEDSIKTRDQMLSKRKARSLPSTLPPKSLLGHGPRVKQRGHSTKNRQHTLTKKLFDEDLKNHVNDISPLNQFRIPSSSVKPQSGNGSETSKKHSHESSAVGSTVHLKRSTPPLKGDLSYSSQSFITDRYDVNKDSDDWSSTNDSHYNEEDTDHSDYLQVSSRRVRLSREPSPTPSISSLAGTLSISGHTQAQLHHRHRHNHTLHKRHSSNASFRTRMPRYSLLGEPLDQTNHDQISLSIYPDSSSSHKESLVGSRPLSLPSFPAADPLNNPFLSSRESSPIPSSFAGTSSDPSLRSSSRNTQIAQVENEKLHELQQELAVIKKQLATLVSARKDDLERAQLSPTYPGNSVPTPPPPPPLSSLVTPKKWTPPNSAASLSMQSVLKELSSSKVQLRKTGSPFVSRISSAIKGSPSSKYTRLSIRSREELENQLEDDSTSNPPSPLANIQHPTNKLIAKSHSSATIPEISIKSSGFSSGTDVDLHWPSPETLERADSRLDTAAKDLAKNWKRRTVISVLVPKIHSREVTDDPKPLELSSSPSLSGVPSAPEGKRKRTGTIGSEDNNTNETTPSSPSSRDPISIVDIKSQDRPRSGPQLAGNKKPRPVRIRSPTLHRSMTDPTQLTHHLQSLAAISGGSAGKRVSFQSSAKDKEQERQWFRESDTDSWRVGS